MENYNLKIRENDDINKRLKKFKRMCDQLGVKKEYRKNNEYKKPSVRLKEKSEMANKRRLKQQNKDRKNRSRI